VAVRLVNALTPGPGARRPYLPPRMAAGCPAAVTAALRAGRRETREALAGRGGRVPGGAEGISAVLDDASSRWRHGSHRRGRPHGSTDGCWPTTGARPWLDRHDGEPSAPALPRSRGLAGINGWAAGCATGPGRGARQRPARPPGVCAPPPGATASTWTPRATQPAASLLDSPASNRVKAAAPFRASPTSSRPAPVSAEEDSSASA